jgi:TPP-dependent 2-oxoacid decarboxylase
MAQTIIQHVLGRLKEVGVDDIFGVAGDYAFPVNDAIVEHPAINWIGCCNELNAAYAADGYARMRGVGAVCTTYGVGELAAISAIARWYAEHLAVIHLIGAPNLPTQEGRALVHHCLRQVTDGDLRLTFMDLSSAERRKLNARSPVVREARAMLERLDAGEPVTRRGPDARRQQLPGGPRDPVHR